MAGCETRGNDMEKLLQGRDVVSALNKEIADRVAGLAEKDIYPKLAIIRCGEDGSDLAYERSVCARAKKLGVAVEVYELPEDVGFDVIANITDTLNADRDTHGVLMFRPLPEKLRERGDELVNRLDPAKDVDGMTDISLSGVFKGKSGGFAPCTAQACLEILDYYGIPCEGKSVCVIGRSLVIGKPVSMLLLSRNATVTICHTKTKDLASIAKKSDIIITAAGSAGSLTADFVSPGQTVIDVSVNYDENAREGEGGFVGDSCFDEVSRIVSAITPVPGGVGTVTTSVLIKHVVMAAEMSLL